MLEYSRSDIEGVLEREKNEAEIVKCEENKFSEHQDLTKSNFFQIWIDYGALPNCDEAPFPYCGSAPDWLFSDLLPESSAEDEDSICIRCEEKSRVLTFNGIVQKRRGLGKPTRVLELMGPGLFACANYPAERGENICDLNDPDFMVGLVLTDPRTEREKSMSNWEVVEGNIFENESWRKIRELPVEKFDLIICRPNGPFSKTGFSHKDRNPHAYLAVVYRMLQKAYRLMSTEDAEMYFELPRVRIERDEYQKIVEFMVVNLLNNGILATTDFSSSSCDPHDPYCVYAGLKIFKRKSSPEEIPNICCSF